jgi:hypothetical protein
MSGEIDPIPNGECKKIMATMICGTLYLPTALPRVILRTVWYEHLELLSILPYWSRYFYDAYYGKPFGPTRTDDGSWRIKTNQEINDLLKGQNIIWFIISEVSN